jgi:hypothetical protein
MRRAYSWASRLASRSLWPSAQTWLTGSSGSGSTSAQPPSCSTLTPSTRTSSWSFNRSTNRRITVPFCSQGVTTVSWARWTRGSSATIFDRRRSEPARSPRSLTNAAVAS